MSKNIEKYLKAVELSIKGMFKDLNTIADNIAAVNTMRNDMTATGNYTAAYIEDVITKEINEKRAPKNALVIDTISAAIEDLKDETLSILNAGDVLEDERITAALSAVANMDPNADVTGAAEIIANQFKGNFPALELLAAVSNNTKAKAVISKKCVNTDSLESITDELKAGVITLTSMNSAGDFVGLFTRCYEYNKVLNKAAELYGVAINADESPALNALSEAAEENAMRHALGL